MPEWPERQGAAAHENSPKPAPPCRGEPRECGALAVRRCRRQCRLRREAVLRAVEHRLKDVAELLDLQVAKVRNATALPSEWAKPAAFHGPSNFSSEFAPGCRTDVCQSGEGLVENTSKGANGDFVVPRHDDGIGTFYTPRYDPAILVQTLRDSPSGRLLQNPRIRDGA